MAKLKDEALNYEPKKTKNIADLDIVNINEVELEDREFTKEDGEAFSFKVMKVGDDEYRVPVSVLKNLKAILAIKPELKSFRVTKTGEGMNTSYTVIPLE